MSEEEGENFARDKGYHHMLCSAKTGEGVNEIFRMLAEGIYHDENIMATLPQKNTLTLVEPPKQTGGCC